MQIFFNSVKDINVYLRSLNTLVCPFCGATSTMVRHGYRYWSISPEQSGIRAWRIHCKKRNGRGGCGRAPSLYLTDTILYHCFNTAQIWGFIEALKSKCSVKAAWESCTTSLSLDTGYRLYKRINKCQSVLRTHLTSRGPPPKTEKAVAPLFQVFEHLKEVFGDLCPPREYQSHFQRNFLSIT